MPDLFLRKSLSNGLTAVLHRDRSSRVTVIQVLVKGGKGAEPPGKQGLSYLATRLAIEIQDARIISRLMRLAAEISMAGHGEYTLVSMACLSENLDPALKILAGTLLKPELTPMRIDKIKAMMNGLRAVEDDEPLNLAFKGMKNIFFEDTPYAGSIYGSEDTLQAIGPEDIGGFYRRHFTAASMVILAASDLDPEILIRRLECCFKDFPGGRPVEESVRGFSLPESQSHAIDRQALQTVVSLGYPLPTLSRDRWLRGRLLESLLGKGINSRLWFLRSKERLAYRLDAGATWYRPGGMIEARLETHPSKAESARGELRKVMLDLHQHGIDAAELASTKNHTKSSLLRDFEAKAERIRILAELEALGVGTDSTQDLLDALDAVTLEDMNGFLRSVLDPERTVELVIGPGLDPRQGENPSGTRIRIKDRGGAAASGRPEAP